MNLADTGSMRHLADLLAAGHEVTFAPTYGGHVEARIEKLGDEPGFDTWTAVEDTPELALWAASPLHGDDEPFPGDGCASEIDGVRCTVHGKHQFHYGPERDGGIRRMWTDADLAPSPLDRQWSPRRAARLRAQARKREAVFDHYGRACACCGATGNLTVDHVDGNGNAHRAKIGYGSARLYRWLVSNGFPDGFQILCGPCNVSKGCRKSCRIDHATAAA